MGYHKSDENMPSGIAPYSYQLTLPGYLAYTFSSATSHTTVRKEAHENKFIEQVREELIKSLPDVLSVCELAKRLFVTRVQLYRKIKEYTQLSPSRYIRKLKLQLALEHLRQGEKSISEIAYAVGFTDPKYFSRVFMQEFQQTPSALRQVSGG